MLTVKIKKMCVITTDEEVTFLDLSIYMQHNPKNYKPILTEIFREVADGSRRKQLDFGGNPDSRADHYA